MRNRCFLQFHLPDSVSYIYLHGVIVNMAEKSEFDATVNANFAISIPAATRDKLGIAKGDILMVSIEKAPRAGGSRR